MFVEDFEKKSNEKSHIRHTTCRCVQDMSKNVHIRLILFLRLLDESTDAIREAQLLETTLFIMKAYRTVFIL